MNGDKNSLSDNFVRSSVVETGVINKRKPSLGLILRKIPTGLVHVGMKKCITMIKIPLAPMGVLAPESAHVRPSARPPIDTSGNFSEHMSGGGNV